eukprot:TRINITY_DN10647_c0_g1_i1.p1 TRINITY_DN10647_c0_g1~~TRINITY_DN10647_c0_g1_i1.p1  ORF type:complete len:263 (+),score=53.62 TRINITY_DN10647_c0_g1_i1:142-930(+)
MVVGLSQRMWRVAVAGVCGSLLNRIGNAVHSPTTVVNGIVLPPTDQFDAEQAARGASSAPSRGPGFVGNATEAPTLHSDKLVSSALMEIWNFENHFFPHRNSKYDRQVEASNEPDGDREGSNTTSEDPGHSSGAGNHASEDRGSSSGAGGHHGPPVFVKKDLKGKYLTQILELTQLDEASNETKEELLKGLVAYQNAVLRLHDEEEVAKSKHLAHVKHEAHEALEELLEPHENTDDRVKLLILGVVFAIAGVVAFTFPKPKL